MPSWQAARTKFDEKSFGKPRKWNQSRQKVNAKSILGGFGRLKPFRGRTGTRSGQVGDAKKSPRGRSWSVWGGAGTFGNRPEPSRGRSKDAPGRLRSDPRVRLVHRALSNTLAERFCNVFASSRESPKLEIRAPTQCFVRVRRSCRSVRTRRHKRRGNLHFSLENRAPAHAGSVPRAPGRAKSGGKTRARAQSGYRSPFFLPVERARRDAGPDAAPARSARSRSPRTPV